MAWWDTLATVVGNLQTSNPAAVTSLVNALQSNSKTNMQVLALLNQVAENPSSAGSVAAAIIALPGVPSQVVADVGALPAVANDHVQLTLLISKIEGELPHGFGF